MLYLAKAEYPLDVDAGAQTERTLERELPPLPLSALRTVLCLASLN